MRYYFCLLALLFYMSGCHLILVNPKSLNSIKKDSTKNLRIGFWIQSDSLFTVKLVRYKNGNEDGICYEVDSLGFYTKGRYKDGNKQGWFKHYNSENKLIYEYFYKNDTIKKENRYYGVTF